MGSIARNKFDASPSAIGYLYQCRYALLEALRQVRTHPGMSISLERFDDIAVEEGVAGRDWIQTKRHSGRVGRLTDASTDLWGTLRVWCEHLSNGRLELPGTRLWIITTAAAPVGSAAAMLQPTKRKPLAALKVLLGVVASSENKKNTDAYHAFTKLSAASRSRLIDAVYVFDGAPQIEDLPRLLEHELWSAASTGQRPHLVRRLEGWWFDRVIEHLSNTRKDCITGEELQSVVDDLRDQFKRDNLPIDPDLPGKPTAISEQDERRILVAQLRLLNVSTRPILHALYDYYRASAQTSRWVREGLLNPGELERYQGRLQDEWERKYDLCVASLGANVTEDERRQIGNKLYDQVMNDFKLLIRARCDEPFVMRGTFHDLANDLRVGWYPGFETRLKAMLGLKEAPV